MTAPWLKFRSAAPAADVVAPAAEAAPWKKFQAPAAAPASRVPMPSEGVNAALKSVLGETAGGIASYLPPVVIANTWMDAAAADTATPDQRSSATQMLEGYENVMRGADQGTNPTAQPEQKVLGEAFQDAGGAWMLGNGDLINPAESVILKDPASGKMMAYSRTAQSNEGGLTGASRVLTQGMLTGPVTGVGRATTLVSEAAGALPAERAAKAADDLAAFDRTGTPVFSPAFQEGPMRGLAKSIAETPIVGAPLNRALDRSLDGAGKAAQDVAGKFGSTPNPQQAGVTVRGGIERFKDARPADVVEDGVKQLDDARLSQIILSPTAETSFKTKQGALYERAWRLIPEEMQKGKSVKDQSRFMSAPSEARAVIEDILARNSRMVQSTKGGEKLEAPPIASGLLGRMVEAIRNKSWTANLQTLRDMRSEVRRLASGMADTEKNVLKASDLDRIQSAITRDMIGQLQRNASKYMEAGQTAEAAKIERAIKEFSRADQYTRLSIERMDKIEKLFNADTGEALARNITNAALGGGRGNIEMLQTLSKTLRPDEMGEVRSMLFSELGRPVGSARNTAEEIKFSVNSFATRWNNMSPEAKALLFDGEHRQAVDDVVRVVDRLANVEAMGNATRSGANAVNMTGLMATLASAASGDYVTPLKVFGGGFTLSYLMSRPAYAKWAAQYLKLKSQTAAAPKAVDAALAVQVNRLAQMAQSDPQLSQIVQHLRLSPAEVGVGQGSKQNGGKENDGTAPRKAEGNQSSNDSGAPNHGGSVSSGGLMINPLAVVQKMKDEWEATEQPIKEETRGFLAPLAEYEDGSVHLAVPEITGLPGFWRAQDRVARDGTPTAGQDPEAVAALAGDTAAAAGGAATGGVAMTAAGKGVPQGAVGAFGGLLGRKSDPAKALAAVSSEIAELAPRYKQLFGREFTSPKARPGTPADEVLAGEQQTLSELRSAIESREAALAKAPEAPTVPRIADRAGERDELMQQARDNPFVKAVPGRQGLPKKKEELDAIERFYQNGGSLPAGPWGRDPLDYQKAVRQAFEGSRQQIAKLKKEKDAAEAKGLKSEVARLREELKEENRQAVYWQGLYNKVIKQLGGDE